MVYLEKFKLTGKTAFVVGGLGLLGIEVSRALAEAGARVIVLDNDLAKGERSLNRLQKINPTAEFVGFDCADIDNLEIKFNALLKQYQHLHIFVNCSYPRTDDWGRAAFTNISFDTFRENVDIHMNTYSWLAKLAADHMVIQDEGGSIIQFGSIYGVLGQDLTIYEGTDMGENMPYAAIKSGIINLTRLMASYYGQWNIRVNNLCSGGITGHVAGKSSQQNPLFVKNYSHKTPLGRLGHPGEVASSVLFLASEAASYITGASLLVDGGWSIV